VGDRSHHPSHHAPPSHRPVSAALPDSEYDARAQTRPQTSGQKTYCRDPNWQVKPASRLSCLLLERRFHQFTACVRKFVFYRTLRALKYKRTHARSSDGFDRKKSGPGWFRGANYLNKFKISNNFDWPLRAFPHVPTSHPSRALLASCPSALHHSG
jgi:hypothetical protein